MTVALLHTPFWLVLAAFGGGCVLLGALVGYAAGRRPVDRDAPASRLPSPRPREPYPFAAPSPSRHR